jgi:hypothetical protein
MTAALQRAIPLGQILAPTVLDQIARMKEWPPDGAAGRAHELLAQMKRIFHEV